ncbi:MAG: GMC family oxidoreductase [Myxococcota bacterium]|nr:GMC family oxidoreductase [Myxococcota bacterium]
MRTRQTDILIVGSGPGGATSAALLAEAGHDVLVVEEGPDLRVDSAPNYSAQEMSQKYRNHGLNTTFGRTGVTYIEGRCVGGASEINAALYHRPHAETLDAWRREFRIDDFGMQALERYFVEIEEELSVSRRADGLAPNSRTLVDGADKLGWKHGEIERFWRYDKDDGPRGRRQSMSETMVPRTRDAGGRVLPDTKVTRILLKGRRAVAAEAVTTLEGGRREKLRITFNQIIVCGGAVQTPVLLRRSGIKRNVGDALRLHPMVRIAARFSETINDPAYGVPVRQVSEFKPAITLGCSHSSLPHVAMWLGDDVADRGAVLADWGKVGVFYVAVQGEGRGTVRALPMLGEPLVRYDLTDADMGRMGQGLEHLGRLLFESGARELYSPIAGQPSLTRPDQLPALGTLPHGTAVAVSTIHLFSSVPMGEDRNTCAVDSFGKLHGYDNIRVHDASILPTSPGVNPQGTIMAIVRRNTRQMLTAL